uniref:Armadillo repeat-containing domain-containing protein n=1 Tax=Globisporangium ultimum (strain ATCC 200006 / CBS 805.95 / DAOM BR144) TaxID=431595 RepID=K3WP64_GLOUD
MLDATTHMLFLLQQAQIKNEHPVDASFLPLSLSLACLLRQLPPGLAPSSGSISFHQLDCLPQHVLEHKVEKLLRGGNAASKAFAFVCSILNYAKITRALLSVCHEHLVNKISSLEATQKIVSIIVNTLGDDDEEIALEEERVRIAPPESPKKKKANSESNRPKAPPSKKKVRKHNSQSDRRAADPAMVIKRALSRDVGDSSAVVDIMRKYPEDERIQSRGLRALTSVVRKFALESNSNSNKPEASLNSKNKQINQSKGIDDTNQRPRANHGSSSNGSSSDDDEVKFEETQLKVSRTAQAMQDAIVYVITSMKKHPHMLPLQREGLLCLSEYVSRDAEAHVSVVTSHGGIVSIMDAMAMLPDDQEAHVGGLSVLAHPQIADVSVVRVNPESRRLVLSAMKRFPLSDQIQGLGCLALANLSLRRDESMVEIVTKGGLETVVAAMKRFPSNSLVQAAGCWLVGIISAKDEDMMLACLDAGALPVCEKARLAFPDDAKVQQNALYAIHRMVPDDAQDDQGPQTSRECTLQ